MSGEPYHVALSYASEQKDYVDQVAKFLKDRNVRCFYDQDEESTLWGKNLAEALQEIFQNGRAYYAVIFISQEYVKKKFPRMEFRAALAEAINREQEYILPARFDSAELPGLFPLVKYIDLQDRPPEDFAELIIRKMTGKGIYLGPYTPTEAPKIQKVPRKQDPEVTLTIKDEPGNPISGAAVYLIHQNGTHRSAKSNKSGEATFAHDGSTADFYTIFVAHKDFPACIIYDFQCDRDCEVNLKRETGIGSIIFPNGTGYIPGIDKDGRLNPILDSSERLYLYAQNISINDSLKQQPVCFKYGENISLVDCRNQTADIRIHRIIKECVILDYIAHGKR